MAKQTQAPSRIKTPPGNKVVRGIEARAIDKNSAPRLVAKGGRGSTVSGGGGTSDGSVEGAGADGGGLTEHIHRTRTN